MSIELDDHEATGKIQRAHKAQTIEDLPEIKSDSNVFGMHNVHDFELAISRAKFKEDPKPNVFVTKELMHYLLRGSNDQSLVYQGIRVYVDGSKEELDKQEAMTSEKRADYLAHKGRTPEQILALKKEAQEAR